MSDELIILQFCFDIEAK